MTEKDFIKGSSRDNVSEQRITANDLSRVREEMQKAEEKDTPYLAVNNDQMYVNGDVNKIQPVKQDYTVIFSFPLSMGDILPKSAVKQGDEYIQKVKMKSVYIKPYNRTRLTRAFGTVMNYMKTSTSNQYEYGSDEYYISLLMNLSEEVSRAFYDLVAIALDVEDEYIDYMLPENVIDNAVKLIGGNPRPSKRD